jgi:hypothetical protein
VAFVTFVGIPVVIMAEGNFTGFSFKRDASGLESLVATVTTGANGKGWFAVMAGSTALAFLHFGHGNGFGFAGNDGTIVTFFAGPLCCRKMFCVTEYGFTCALYLVGYVTYLALMAENAIFFRSNAECLDAAVACAAGFGFLHLDHGEATTFSGVEDRIVTYFAVVVVLAEVGGMAEDHGCGMLEAETDVFYVCCEGVDDCQNKNSEGQEG